MRTYDDDPYEKPDPNCDRCNDTGIGYRGRPCIKCGLYDDPTPRQQWDAQVEAIADRFANALVDPTGTPTACLCDACSDSGFVYVGCGVDQPCPRCTQPHNEDEEDAA